jgi:hypothetical protein
MMIRKSGEFQRFFDEEIRDGVFHYDRNNRRGYAEGALTFAAVSSPPVAKRRWSMRYGF